MTHSEIRLQIRLWIRDLTPSLNGVYSFKDLYEFLRGLFNDDTLWDTMGRTSRIGDHMVRMEVLRSVRLNQSVTKVRPGVYCFG